MKDQVFYIVDVFAENRFAGNQLAVFRNGKDYSDAEMQKLALEMNYSETTFILSDKKKKGGYDVRIFTPAKEVSFAGHPTLGTAYIILREIAGEDIDTITLNLQVGQIPVSLDLNNGELELLWMKQVSPKFGRVFSASETAGSLGLDLNDIDKKYPIQEVSTGIPFLIIPLQSLEAVKKAKVDKERFFSLVKDADAKALLIFCPHTYRDENDLNVRVFADYYDVPEDPATGSANGCLAGYLVKYRYFNHNKIRVRVEQGYEIKRPSLLFLKAEKKREKIDVFVGGKVFMVAKGTLCK